MIKRKKEKEGKRNTKRILQIVSFRWSDTIENSSPFFCFLSGYVVFTFKIHWCSFLFLYAIFFVVVSFVFFARFHTQVLSRLWPVSPSLPYSPRFSTFFFLSCNTSTTNKHNKKQRKFFFHFLFFFCTLS